MKKAKLDYHNSVNYKLADPAKVLAQKEGKATAKNMPYGFTEVEGSRGESAYVFDIGKFYGALVQEGLGTKSLIAQSVYKSTGESYFAAIAQDTVAAVINDLISVGARPVVLNAYWSSSSYNWLKDNKLTTDFILGWRKACDKAGVTWGGGETQSLPAIVESGALEFAGSSFGVIKPKKNLIQDSNIKSGDAILLLGSSGVHANGISLAREVAKQLKAGYQTKLSSSLTYGQALLVPTTLYADFVRRLFDNKLDVHYLSNITGHGWRKIMRGTPEFSYIIEKIPEPQAIFDFLRINTGSSLEEMYSNFNMGAGYAVYLPKKDALKAQKIAQSLKIKSIIAGYVENGPKQLVIRPKNIIYKGESLEVR